MIRIHLISIFCLMGVLAITAAGESHYPIVTPGAEIAVRLLDRISTDAAAAGDTFAALIEKDVEEDGKTIIPEGADAKVELVASPEVGPGGTKIYGIELQKIQIDGAWYPITTGYAKSKSTIQKVPAGEVPRGTTDVGEVIAAHGEDATVATVRGAGVSFQVLQGPDVEVAPDVVLHFTLAEALSLRPH